MELKWTNKALSDIARLLWVCGCGESVCGRTASKSKADAVVFAAKRQKGFIVVIAQVEIALQLFAARRIDIATKAVALLLSQNANRH